MSVTTNIVDSKKVSRNQNKSLNFNALGERGTAAVTLYRAFPDGTPDPKPVEHTTLEAFLAMIQSQDQIEASEKLTELYSNYLGCKEKKDKDVAKKSYDVAKKQLPGFALGNLTYRSDDESNFYEYVPCMGFDLDGCMSEYHRFEFQHFLKGLPYVYATFPSANGHGLRILVWTAATYESHRLIYNQILDELCKFLKLTTNKKDGTYFDSTCQNESRFFYFKQVKKNDFYLNPNSEIFVSKLENNVITMLTANEPKPMPDTVASIVEKTPDTLPTAMFENTDYAYVDEINDYLKMDILMRNIDTNQPRKIQCFNFGCVCRENNVDFDNAKTFALKEFWDAENKNPEKIIQAQLKDGYAQSVVKWTDQQFEAYIGKRYKIKVIKNEPELELQKLKDKVYDGAVKVHDDLLKLNNAVALGEILENLNSAAPMEGDEPSSSNEKVAVFDILTTLKNYRENLPAGQSESFYLQKMEKIAASLLAKEKDDNVYLVKDIVKSFKLDAKSLAKNIKSEKQHLAAQQAPEEDADDRTAEEKLCFHKYMFWERDNCYHSMSNGRKWTISNFVMKPVMLIIGLKEPLRIVRIANKIGRVNLIALKSKAFVDLKSFKEAVGGYGNYVMKGRDVDMYENITEKIFAEMPDAYAVTGLGLHKTGFYTWGNGITTPEGKFLAVDTNGMVTHADTNYWLPAFSDMAADLQQEDEYDYEFEKKFVYCSDNQSITFKEWTQKMINIYGEKGMIAVAYYCAALYRDIVYNYLGFFPHLNLFGQSGSGKSWMAQSITAMFGFRIPPFHLGHGTHVGFFRRLAKIQNGIVWFDEYSNDISIFRVEAMKAAYDGNGHEKAGEGENSKTTKVKSALIIAGQKHMTKDIALFKRTISLNFALADQTPEREAAGKALKEIENTGVLSQLTVQAMSFRNEVKENFRDKFTAIRKFVSKDITAEERTINNHIVPLAITAILMDHLDFAFTKKQLTDFIINNIRVQSDNMSKEDETAGWWKMIQFLAESDLLKCGLDYMVQMKHQITVLADNKRIATKVVDFERQPVLFLRFERAHPLYMQYSKMQFGVNGLPQSSLEYYLRGEKYFLGEVKTKRFVNESKGCFAFKFSPYINLPETPKILEKKDILLKS